MDEINTEKQYEKAEEVRDAMREDGTVVNEYRYMICRKCGFQRGIDNELGNCNGWLHTIPYDTNDTHA